ncbi:DUF2846 domain-containing protein [Aquidulcibacter sp.]|uniref:DUF2846 domain-containing protein n=1 Tax=Aquidulcibacter sp. TaxID=2052990 RepID=UPI0025B9470D|nr:DUF2846 domain-containing protein [Aquidulcibacter sp.]MCA3693345.1 DUF2846 domain-containing protein [Aquidulcibacter sp.]
MKSVDTTKPLLDMRGLVATVSLMAFSMSGSSAFAQAAMATPPAEPAPATAPPAAEAPPAPPSAEPAPTPPTEAAPAPAPAPEAPAQPVVAFPGPNPIMAPPEGKGQVVFFRQAKLTGAALSFSIREGDTGIGKLQNGSYFVHVVDPGPREFNIQSEVTDTLRLEIEPGETYFVVQSITMGIMIGRPILTPSDAQTFQNKKMKVTTAVATDRKPRK